MSLLTPAQAETLIEQHLACLPIESLPLTQVAGAVLRENIYSERDQPPFDRVAMDGIAVTSAAAASHPRLRVAGYQAAGDPPQTLSDPASCIEIMTGAMLPRGCDAVIPVEQVQRQGDVAEIARKPVQPWQNIHRRGSDCRQGALLLAAGTRLSPPEVAIAAGAGMARLRVSAQPMIVVISTGNELVEPGEVIEPHQVRRSNAYGITASLRQHGYTRVADDHLRDDEAELTERLGFHLRTHDVLILSGGVSMGRMDLVPKVLEKLGVSLVFHHVAQRPGKPMWFGVAESGPAVFALPGNPVSTLVCLSRYVLPALRAAMGQTPREPPRIALTEPVEVKTPLAFYIPVKLRHDDWGRTSAEPRPTNGSGDFTSLAGTDGFVELPPGPNTFPKGFVARFYRW
ncbi:MAG TPA: molybdopterin molybdotransferase MoeA [Steroidobacteraceae bacterium]|jgi:molybdopterin molybdotransferase|nr:molybdopterin molybdotransferase MoeA [Steroidobacteraceae bacterium]